MSRIQAKFKVGSIIDNGPGGKVVHLSAVYSNDPNSPNYSWSQATPAGQTSLVITNPEAANAFEMGAEYLLDLTKVEQSSVGAGDDVAQKGATA